MPFGLGGGPWWLYGRANQRGWPWRCFRYPSYQQPTKKEELDALREGAEALKEELKAISERISQLEEKKE